MSGDASSQGSALSRMDPAFLTQALELAPYGMALFDLELRYLAANRDWCIAKSDEEDNLVGRRLYDLEPQTSDRRREAHQRSLKGAAESVAADYCVRPDGVERWFAWSTHPLRDVSGLICGLAMFEKDVTAEKLDEIALRDAEKRLRASEEQHRLVFYAASYPCSLSTLADGLIVEANDAFVELFGSSREAVIGRNARELGIVADLSHRDEILRILAESGSVRDFESTFRRKDGVLLICRQNADRLSLRGQDYLLVTTRDITEQRRLERALAEASAMEQQKLGRQLHEGLGQDLAGISLLATATAATLRTAQSGSAHDVNRISELLGQSVGRCRALAAELSPLSFVGGDLRYALSEMMELQRRAFGIDGDVEVFRAANARFGQGSAEALYRIAQEAVSNARRHGRASRIVIKLEVQDDRVRLEIHDNGAWPSPRVADSPGMGLRLMDYRARLIGGHLWIGTAPQGGTVVRAECPNR